MVAFVLKKVKVGIDQSEEMAQSEGFPLQNLGWGKTKLTIKYLHQGNNYRKAVEQLHPATQLPIYENVHKVQTA